MDENLDSFVEKIKNENYELDCDGVIWFSPKDGYEEGPNISIDRLLIKIKGQLDQENDFIFKPCDSISLTNENEFAEICNLMGQKKLRESGGTGSSRQYEIFKKEWSKEKQYSVSNIASLIMNSGIFIQDTETINIEPNHKPDQTNDGYQIIWLKNNDSFFNLAKIRAKLNNSKRNDIGDVVQIDDVGCLISLLKFYRNLILEGVPGTGKTFVFKDIVKRWGDCFTDNKTKPKFIQGEAITLHPAVTYEDFMEGLRPVGNKKDLGDYRKCSESASNICLKVEDSKPKKEDLSEKWFHVKPDNEPTGNSLDFDYKYGFFLRICCKAVNNPLNHYLVLLDEINRCNIPKVFGDLITTMENSKRATWDKDKGEWNLDKAQVVALPGSGRLFFVPENIYIVATMNTSDRSVAPLDAALRRRFAFQRIKPLGFGSNNESKYDISSLIWNKIGFGITPDQEFKKAVGFWKEINKNLERDLGEDAMLGHSYLYDLAKKIMGSGSKSENLVEHFWNHDVLPDLSEIFNSSNYNQKEIEDFFSLNNALKGHFTVTKLAVGSNRSSRIVYKQGEKKVSDKIANSANTSE